MSKNKDGSIDYKKEYEKHKKRSQYYYILAVALLLGLLITSAATLIHGDNTDDGQSVIPEVQKGGSRAVPQESTLPSDQP